MDSLPIFAVLQELKSKLQKKSIVVLEAPPGAGKTTIVPISLLEEDWLLGKNIIVLEPRRLAARNAANRMSVLVNEELGQTIGYRVRFESKVSSKTRIEVVTEGVFTRRIQNDPELKNVGLVIFDEFHERNLQSDLGLALALEVQSALREDLKILIMSATLDTRLVSDFLNAEFVKSEGRAYPVEIRYLSESTLKLIPSIENAIKKALKDKGDILIFLPGSREIKKIQKVLEENFNLANTIICPLYGELSQKEQEIAIFPDKLGRRKIILSTNIAESSLTIEGVSIVIDSGLCRIPCFDPSSGMSKLETVQIAKDSMTQRTGRAGRLGPGISYRVWSSEEEKHFLDKTKPEILEADLSQFLLDVCLWGTPISELKFLDKPNESSIQRSKKLLIDLNLLDKNGKITEIGKRVSKLPLHPRLGYMIISSIKFNLLYLASVLAAILNEKNIFSAGHFSYRQSDLGLQIEEFQNTKNSFLSKKIQMSTEEIFRIGFSESNANKEILDISKIGLLLSFAYPDRIGRLREKNGRSYKLSSGKGAVLRENDSLIGSEFLVVSDLDGDRKEALIFSAAKIKLEEILELKNKEIIVKKSASMDEKSGKISVFQESVIGELILVSKEIPDEITSELLQSIWKKYLEERGLSVLPWSDEAENFRKRSELLRNFVVDLPSLEDKHLLQNLDIWLLPFLGSVRRISELNSINLLEIIKSMYSYSQLQLLEKEMPERLEVPSGSNIKLEYKKDEVILKVKIQEIFGMPDSPRIASGKIVLTLYLLSPAMRPIQITKDLSNFWDKTYIEVKKELAGRYPKHPWPDNPRLAIPTKFTKKKSNMPY